MRDRIEYRKKDRKIEGKWWWLECCTARMKLKVVGDLEGALEEYWRRASGWLSQLREHLLGCLLTTLRMRLVWLQAQADKVRVIWGTVNRERV